MFGKRIGLETPRDMASNDNEHLGQMRMWKDLKNIIFQFPLMFGATATVYKDCCRSDSNRD